MKMKIKLYFLKKNGNLSSISLKSMSSESNTLSLQNKNNLLRMCKRDFEQRYDYIVDEAIGNYWQCKKCKNVMTNDSGEFIHAGALICNYIITPWIFRIARPGVRLECVYCSVSFLYTRVCRHKSHCPFYNNGRLQNQHGVYVTFSSPLREDCVLKFNEALTDSFTHNLSQEELVRLSNDIDRSHCGIAPGDPELMEK